MSIVEILSVGFFLIVLLAAWFGWKAGTEQEARVRYWGAIAVYSVVWYIVSWNVSHIG